MARLLHDILDRQALNHPDLPLTLCSGGVLRYREAREIVYRLARALVASGIRVGDRVAILSPNSPEYLLLYFAASLAGAVVVPLNVRLAPGELEYVLQDAEPRIVFADASLRDRLDAIRGRLSSVTHWIGLGDQASGRPGWADVRRWLADASPYHQLPRCTPELDVLQLYTSATTGYPKGAVITQRALLANIEQIGTVLRLGPGDRTLVVAPLFHAGVVPAALVPIFHASILVIHSRFVAQEVVDTLHRDAIAYVLLVPTMMQACLHCLEHRDQPAFPALKFLYYGAQPVNEELLRGALSTFGCGFIQSYGLTEATQAVTFLTPADHTRGLTERPSLLRSAGTPAPRTEVRIVDSQGQQVPPGVAGEIIVRGPQLMREYWKRPEDTARTLHEGWLRTGDVGWIDEEGYLYILDRVKDMIISGGENVYSSVVENTLAWHPDIQEVAVIGIPHPYWGESVHAVVVLKPGVPTTTRAAEKIIEFCRERLAGFELPRSLEFVDQLPRNASGKILKRLLRERIRSMAPTEFAWSTER